jgi:serine/threonine protein phosphatase PrpC
VTVYSGDIGNFSAFAGGSQAELDGGRLLLASDGLIKYATAEQVSGLATQGSVAAAANALANYVRLPSGALRDDVAVVLLSRDSN